MGSYGAGNRVFGYVSNNMIELLEKSDISTQKKGLSLGFQFFEYLGFGFGYFANLWQISN